ncbi:uncharacterized protein [Fopius arisanus]|uniref:Uncharacterized protein isoform X2 n=1 Tax=Fopius arisanus TaxID=64838 RepID=A0A9R1TBT0_9HYME|nr:PREDICTED: uncharacterized protein LOC105268645 isoform X2 [Fopius arisanus]
MDLPVKRRRRVRVKPETTPETTPEVTPEVIQDVEDFDGPGLLSLPTEILIEILSYLDYTDSYSLECVSKRFELAQTPWRDYEL